LAALTPGSRPRFPIVLRIFFVSSFVSNFVPSVAADMYRAYALARHDVRLAESTASVLMDRMLGVLSMVIVGLCALPVARDLAVQRGLIAGLVIASAACAAGAVMVFSESAAGAAMRIVAMVPSAALRRMAAALTDAVRRYARHHAELVRVLIMSVLVQAIRVLQAWCLGEALGIQLPLVLYFAFVPVILLIMQLPITINGLGTTQAAFAGFFAGSGAREAPVVALSVLFLVLGVVGSLPGGLLYAVGPAPELPGAPVP
ncbi:MAG: lysylphosphatidylglycerol synthase transmembrane domain-containing protein, partial [Acidobacteriota bacterium]